MFFEKLNNTKFSLPKYEIKERSKVKRSVASPHESFTCFWFLHLKKDVEKCKVDSSAYEWI